MPIDHYTHIQRTLHQGAHLSGMIQLEAVLAYRNSIENCTRHPVRVLNRNRNGKSCPGHPAGDAIAAACWQAAESDDRLQIIQVLSSYEERVN